jgi:hypothetical protein
MIKHFVFLLRRNMSSIKHCWDAAVLVGAFFVSRQRVNVYLSQARRWMVDESE